MFFEQRSSSRINKNYNLQMQSVLEETCLMLRDPEMRKNTLFCKGSSRIPTLGGNSRKRQTEQKALDCLWDS